MAVARGKLAIGRHRGDRQPALQARSLQHRLRAFAQKEGGEAPQVADRRVHRPVGHFVSAAFVLLLWSDCAIPRGSRTCFGMYSMYVSPAARESAAPSTANPTLE